MKYILICIFSLTLFGSQLTYKQIINIVFDSSAALKITFLNDTLVLDKTEYGMLLSNLPALRNTYPQLSAINLDKIKISKKKINGITYFSFPYSTDFKWKPTKKFRKFFPKYVYRYRDTFKVRPLNEFLSQDNSKIFLLFSVRFDSCHACDPLVFAASVDVKTHKVSVPLKYITQAGNNGGIVHTKHIILNKKTDGAILYGNFTNQSYTIATTKLISFTDTKIKQILYLPEENQILKCSIKTIDTNSQIKDILKKDFDRKLNIIKDDYSNEYFCKNYEKYSSLFCDLFIKKSKKQMPTIYEVITSFEKKIYHDKNKKQTIKHIGTIEYQYNYKNGKYVKDKGWIYIY